MCFSWGKSLHMKKRKYAHVYAYDRILETKGWKPSSRLSNLLLISTQLSKET